MGDDGRMPARLVRQAALLAVPLLVLTAHPEPTTAAIAAIVAIALAATLGARYLAVVIAVHLRGVGDRAPRHSRGLDEVPAPRHPNTRGHRRPRAPSPSAAVA